MATTPWATFYDEVLPYLRGCPVPMAREKIIEAGIEFCERSRVWRADHAPINAVADQATYNFAPPAETKVVRIERAWFDGEEILPKSEDELAVIFANWPTEAGVPDWYLQELPESVRLVPYPSAALTGALVMKVSLKPSQAASGLDTLLWEKYVTEIAAGALGKLMVMPDKPWTNVSQSVYYMGMFDSGCAQAQLDGIKGHTKARIQASRPRARFM